MDLYDEAAAHVALCAALGGSYTGTLRGPVVTNPATGEQSRVILEYENGECSGRYVTMAAR